MEALPALRGYLPQHPGPSPPHVTLSKVSKGESGAICQQDWTANGESPTLGYKRDSFCALVKVSHTLAGIGPTLEEMTGLACTAGGKQTGALCGTDGVH